MLQIIPAIDLRKGKVVRLVHGDVKKETIYYNNPEEVAKDFARQGASRLHVVDLEGAFRGSVQNMESIKKIASEINFPLQVGGGIRDLKTAENLFSLGVNKVILGTIAVQNPSLVKKFVENFGEDKVIVGIDARKGKVAVKGWVESSERNALDLAQEMESFGVKEIIYTDILKDGTLEGPNLKELENMAINTNLSIIASGGVSSLEDIKDLQKLVTTGITGVITGQALYTGRFTLYQAISL